MSLPSPSVEAERRSDRSNLMLRVASALVLAPVAIGVAYLGGWWFAAFWLAAALGVLWEWASLVAPAKKLPVAAIGSAGLVASTVALMIGSPLIALAIMLAGAIAAGLFGTIEGRLWSATGIVYAAAIVLCPVLLRQDALLGFAAIMLVFAVVWGSDIAAYFAGRLIGGPKLWPRVSPKKTWSGAIVGTLVAIAAGIAVAASAGISRLALVGVICGVLSVVSQAGDLYESSIKRRFGAKDSGQLIPGHGGLMDRLDGFVTAAAAAAIIGVLRGGWETPSQGLLIW